MRVATEEAWRNSGNATTERSLDILMKRSGVSRRGVAGYIGGLEEGKRGRTGKRRETKLCNGGPNTRELIGAPLYKKNERERKDRDENRGEERGKRVWERMADSHAYSC
jgi:hypothetical protein